MNKTCPHCGAALPEDVSFCPHCAKSVNERMESRPPRLRPVRAIFAAAVLLLIAAIGVMVWFANRPQTYDSGDTAEVIYTDKEGSYRLVIGYDDNPNQPVPQYYTIARGESTSRVPSRLFIRRMDNGANAAAEFLEKVDNATFEIISQLEDPNPVTCSEPAPHDGFPEAALVSLLDYNNRSLTSELVWTLHMKNGDTIIVREQLVIQPIEILEFRPEDTPMNTIAELQALIDELTERVNGVDTLANIYLPPITYDSEVLNLTTPGLTLYGSTEDEERTTFTNTVHIPGGYGSSLILYDLDFVGDGAGVGLSAAGMTIARGCTFTGWRTGLLAFGDSWVGFLACRFEDNEIGFHFNCAEGSPNRTVYNNNDFRNNGTAVLLEQVPTDTTLNFQGSVFEDNGTDIDNRCDHPIDISEATFE